MNGMLTHTLTQLAYQSPVLLVLFVGLILSVAFWDRCPVPCALTLVGTGLLLLVSVAQTIFTQYLFHASWGQERLASMLTAVGLVCTLIYTVGMALCLAAVFVGRSGPCESERAPLTGG